MSKNKSKIYFKKKEFTSQLYNLKGYPIIQAWLNENINTITKIWKDTNKDKARPVPAEVTCQANIFDRVVKELGLKVSPVEPKIQFFYGGSQGHFVNIRRK